VTNEELAAAGVLATVSHGERTAQMFVGIALGFARDGIAGAARTVTLGTTSLNDKVRNDPVKADTVIEAAVGQFLEVGDRTGSFFIIQICVDLPFFGFDDGKLH